jgi:hypothetical protein
MSLWLGDYSPDDQRQNTTTLDPLPHLILHGKESWASLRAVNYTTRPGQADQLHVDLWWRGANITLDPGTFSYNAAPPWENALTCTAVHNTVTVAGQDQMTRAGRFLWLDWPRVYIYNYPADDRKVAAFHEGYLRRFQVTHRRELGLMQDDSWVVVDKLLPGRKPGQLLFTLHWLLPDRPWELAGTSLRLDSPMGPLQLELASSIPDPESQIQLIRAGQVLVGQNTLGTIFGWSSPTYGVKHPALSLRYTLHAVPPLEITTRFILG